MKFNVKIVRLSKYLDKYNVAINEDAKTISKEDYEEIRSMLVEVDRKTAYPIYLTDTIRVYRDDTYSTQLLINQLTGISDTSNSMTINIGDTKSNSWGSIVITYNPTTSTGSIIMEEI